MTHPPTEPVLEPEIPIVDAHHHLWLMSEAAIEGMANAEGAVARGLAAVAARHPRYLLDELLADLRGGHDVRATVYMSAGSMARADGPAHLRSVGEVEFVNGVAAMTASRAFGDIRVCAGIVSGVDLRHDRVDEILDAHVRAGGGRLRGIRSPGMHDDDPVLAGPGSEAGMFADPRFRAGLARLGERGLSFDALVLEPQLPEIVDLARAFPDVRIVVNHLGAPVGIGRYAGRREERFPAWLASIRELASCANVAMKLGGIGIPFSGFPSVGTGSAASEQLAAEWRPYVEACIESFGADRCMFESNFPVDHAVGSYVAVWNAFKRLAAGASAAEKSALFSGTASRVYRLDTGGLGEEEEPA